MNEKIYSSLKDLKSSKVNEGNFSGTFGISSRESKTIAKSQRNAFNSQNLIESQKLIIKNQSNNNTYNNNFQHHVKNNYNNVNFIPENRKNNSMNVHNNINFPQNQIHSQKISYPQNQINSSVIIQNQNRNVNSINQNNYSMNLQRPNELYHTNIQVLINDKKKKIKFFYINYS